MKTPSNSVINIDMVSDIVCPWCWLGKRYFDQAITRAKKELNSPSFEINFRPYMLDPTLPEDGSPYKAYMTKKFGDSPSNRFAQMREHLEKAAPDAGIKFRFDDIPMRPNTLRAHTLLYWAQGQGRGAPMKEALFNAFFNDLKDIGNIEVLCELAGRVGMDKALTQELLSTGRDQDKVKEEIVFFQNLGVSGVPFFIYNGQYGLSGAQPPDAHLEIMRNIITGKDTS